MKIFRKLFLGFKRFIVISKINQVMLMHPEKLLKDKRSYGMLHESCGRDVHIVLYDTPRIDALVPSICGVCAYMVVSKTGRLVLFTKGIPTDFSKLTYIHHFIFGHELGHVYNGDADRLIDSESYVTLDDNASEIAADKYAFKYLKKYFPNLTDSCIKSIGSIFFTEAIAEFTKMGADKRFIDDMEKRMTAFTAL